MDLGIKGKTALVLGGSRGIGRATARELAQAGANVAIVARNQAKIEEAVTELGALGVQACGIAADLFDIRSYDRVVAECTASLGAPDIAIYNLDPPPPGGFYDIDEDQLAQAYQIVVLNYSRMLRLVLPHMRARKWGRVVTIGSGTAKELVRGGFGWPFHYILANSSRVAATAFAKTVAAEVAADGVTINTIATGYIRSEQQEAWTANRASDQDQAATDFEAAMLANIPMGRTGTTQEMASLAAFLCSDLASYTTGEIISCSGGSANSIL